MNQTELAYHAETLWALFRSYVEVHGIDSQTTGILIVSELTSDPNAQPAFHIMYAGDPKTAAVTMTRAAMAELKRAGVRLPGAGG